MDKTNSVGIIKESAGKATVTHTDGTVETAAIGTLIYEGDIVETRDHGAVNITFTDNTTFAVSENAKMAIDQYVFDPATQHGENNFSVLRGVFVYTSGLIGHADPDDVKIHTPVGSIGIRGTTIMGTITGGGDSHITVVEGAIVVSNNTGEQTLSQQFETVTLAGIDHPIQSNGVLSADTIVTNYNVLRTVSGPLFSTFDDLGKTTRPATQETPQPDATHPAQHEAAPPVRSDVSPEHSSLDAGFETNTATKVAVLAASGSLLQTLAAADPVVTKIATLYAAEKILTSIAVLSDQPYINLATIKTAVAGAAAPTPNTSLNGIIDGVARDGRFMAGSSDSQDGIRVTSLGDYNHDGRVNIAYTDNNGHLYIADSTGNNATLDLSSGPFNLTDTTSVSIAAAGDFNRDGRADIVIGAFNADDGMQFNSGAVYIAGGASPGSGSTAPAVTGFASGQMAGFSVAGIGDFNGDGYSDILIGAPYSSGVGHAYMLLGHTGTGAINVSSLNASQGFVMTGLNSAGFGQSVAGIGDINNDGYSDLAVSSPGTNSVSIHFGNPAGINTNPLTITGLQAGSTPGLIALGDTNGDGISDFGIHDTIANTFSVLDGASSRTAGSIALSGSNVTFTAPAGASMIAAGSAGDFNGDGNSDAMLALRSGSNVDIYVVYGTPGLSGTINPASLPDAAGFHMTLDLSSPQFNLANPSTETISLSLTSAGDLNGDGYDDLLIGLPGIDANGGSHSNDGGVLVVYGGAEASTPAFSALAGLENAIRDGQSLIGTTGNDTLGNLGGNGVIADVTFKAGNGNDIINLYGHTAHMIDGGNGSDTLNLFATGLLDLSGMTQNNLKGIETIQMQTTGATLKLGLDDIFSLMQQSADGILRITDQTNGGSGSGVTHLEIATNGSAFALPASSGTVNTGGETFNDYAFGNYHLYVDTTVNTTAVV